MLHYFRKIIIPLFLILTTFARAIDKDKLPTPVLPKEDMVVVDEKGEKIGYRPLEKNTTLYLDSRVNVYVPLEIISDVDIDALIIDDSKVKIPFTVELNRTPEKKDYFKLKYSETEIDIDRDGNIDTYIYSSPFLNSKIEKDNIVYIDGKNISKEGEFVKIIYMTVEVRE